MGTVWITFATEDNVEGDIDYLAQEIGRFGLRTRLHPLFPDEDDKIDRLMPAFLARPDQADCWILYGSENTFRSDRIERVSRVVHRAVEERSAFPRIGLFTSEASMAQAESIPLTDKLFVDDSEWRSQIGAALGIDIKTVTSSEGKLPPYLAKLRPAASQTQNEPFKFTFEFRPKMGRWDPVLFAILPEESARVAPEILNHPYEQGFSEDGQWYFVRGRILATPRNSCLVGMKALPTRLAFGQEGTDEVVILTVSSPN